MTFPSEISPAAVQLRAVAEAKLARTAPAPHHGQTYWGLVHELEVHQIELEMQNEALRDSIAALGASNRHFVDFYENSPVGCLTLTDSGLIDEVNLPGTKLLGAEKSQLLQQKFSNFVAPEYAGIWQAHFAKMLTLNDGLDCDLELKREDGSHLHVRIDSLKLTLDGLKPLIRVVFTETTTQQELKARLAETAERMDLAVLGSNLGLWDINLPGGSFTHTPRVSEMLGYEPAALAKNIQTIAWLLHPDDRDGVHAAVQSCLKGDAPDFVAEYRARHRRDNWVWIVSRGKVVARDHNGQPTRVAGTSLDVSEKKRSENILKAREARLSSLLASMQDIVLVIDTSGSVVEYFHPQFARRPPVKAREEILGRSYHESLPAAAAHCFDDAIAGILEDNQPRTFEYSLTIAGSEYLSSATMSPLFADASIPNSFPTGFLAVIRDVTAERLAQKELLRLARNERGEDGLTG